MISSISIDRSLVTVITFDFYLIKWGKPDKGNFHLAWFEMRAKDFLTDYSSNPKIKPYSKNTQAKVEFLKQKYPLCDCNFH